MFIIENLRVLSSVNKIFANQIFSAIKSAYFVPFIPLYKRSRRITRSDGPRESDRKLPDYFT